MTKSFLQRETNLAAHGIAVDLAHVHPSIRPVNVADLKGPGVQVAVEYRKSGVVGQHTIVHRQDAFVIRLDPGNLFGGEISVQQL